MDNEIEVRISEIEKNIEERMFKKMNDEKLALQKKQDEESIAIEKAKLLEEKRAFEAEKATYSKSNPTSRVEVVQNVWRDVAQAMVEKRALSINGAGAVNLVNEIFVQAQKMSKFYNMVSTFTGESAVHRVPVLTPTLAVPSAGTEGATNISADSTAVYVGRDITLYPYYSILPVSRGAENLSANLEAKLPSIFAEAFVSAIDAAILTGSGSSAPFGVFTAAATGVPTSQDVTLAAHSDDSISWANMLQLVASAKGYFNDEELAIAIHPTLLAQVIADTNGNDALRNELLMRGTIRGIKVVETANAPTTLTAGSYVAVVGRFKDYAFAKANELRIDPILEVGKDTITYQAWMYMGGRPAVGAHFWRAKTAT